MLLLVLLFLYSLGRLFLLSGRRTGDESLCVCGGDRQETNRIARGRGAEQGILCRPWGKALMLICCFLPPPSPPPAAAAAAAAAAFNRNQEVDVCCC